MILKYGEGIGEKNCNKNTQWHIQDRIYDSRRLCPALTSFKADYLIIIFEEEDEEMSCLFCKHYKGLKNHCSKGTLIQNLSESFNCDEYEYNGELRNDTNKI